MSVGLSASEIFGCADAEQGQATGQHRPGGFGEREPGAVGGRGFLVPERQHEVLEQKKGVGDPDKVPGEPVGSPVRGGEPEGVGVLGENGEEVGALAGGVIETAGRVAVVANLAPGPYVTTHADAEPEGAGCSVGGHGSGRARSGPGRGVALALEKVIGADPGPVVGRRVQQRPAGGVGTERGGILRSGHGPQVHRLAVPHLGPSTLGGDDPYEGVGDDLGTRVIGNAQLDDLPGETVAVPVPLAPRQHLVHQSGGGSTPRVMLRKPGPVTVTSATPGSSPMCGRRISATSSAGEPGRPREPQGDVGRIVPASPGPGRTHPDTDRHGNAQLPPIDSTTHRAQHGTGELDGGHGTSLGEKGVGLRPGLVDRPGCGRGL